MRQCLLGLILLGAGAAWARTAPPALTRVIGTDGQKFISLVGKCAQNETYHPLARSRADIVKDKDGKDLKMWLETPVISEYDRFGRVHCAFRCAPNFEPMAVETLIMCVGFR